MGSWDWLLGSEDKMTKLDNKSAGQNQLHGSILDQLKKLMSGGGGYDQAIQHFQDLIGPGGFEKFSDPYRQQFNQKTLPGIAEKFAGGGALSSSGFGQALGGASSDFEAQLAQLFGNKQDQAAQGIFSQFNEMSNQGLNYEPFTYHEQKGEGGLLKPLLTAGATALGGPLAGAGVSGIEALFKKLSGGQGNSLQGASGRGW
jgi:hypothetical protein